MADGILGRAGSSFLQQGDSGIRPDGANALFSLQEKMCFSCAEVDEKMKTGRSLFYTTSELWVQLSFQEGEEAGEEVSILRGGKGTVSCRNDSHLKFTPKFKHLFDSFSMDLSSPSHPGREHDPGRTRDTEGSIASNSHKAKSQ